MRPRPIRPHKKLSRNPRCSPSSRKGKLIVDHSHA
jgi:hypothetical protein